MYWPRSSSVRVLLTLLCFAIAALTARSPHAQTSPGFWWDHSGAVDGFAVTVDGIRTDYGLSPLAADGTCNCSIPASFLGARRVVTVSAYNAAGETSSAVFLVGPTANAGGPYQGTTDTAVNVTAAASTDQTSTITSYRWTWGDGTPATTTATATASHRYSAAGTYSIALLVTDGDGASHSATTTAAIAAVTPAPSAPASPTPADAATNVATNPTLTWTSSGATAYDVYFGSSATPPLAASNSPSASYTPPVLANSTTYFWKVVARNAQGSTSGPVWSFTTSVAATAAITRVQVTGKNAAATTATSLSFASATRAGNWVAVLIRANAANAALTVKDSGGNAFRLAAQRNVTTATAAVTLAAFYAEHIVGGTDRVTVSQPSASAMQVLIIEYAGIATTNSVDQVAFAQGAGTIVNSGAASTTAANDLLLGVIATGTSAAITRGTGYSIVRRVPNSSTAALLAIEQRTLASPGSAAATATLGASNHWGALLIAVKPR